MFGLQIHRGCVFQWERTSYSYSPVIWIIHNGTIRPRCLNSLQLSALVSKQPVSVDGCLGTFSCSGLFNRKWKPKWKTSEVTSWVSCVTCLAGGWVWVKSSGFHWNLVGYGHTWEICSGGSKGGREGQAPPPPRAQILSISCSFLKNMAKSYVGAPPAGSWRPLLGEFLDPPLIWIQIRLFEFYWNSWTWWKLLRNSFWIRCIPLKITVLGE